MSLSTRIVVAPSLRLGLLSAGCAVGGVVVLLATALARRPDAPFVPGALAAVAVGLLVARLVRSLRSDGACVLLLAEGSHVEVDSLRSMGDQPCSVAPSSMAWPGVQTPGGRGFSVLVLERPAGGDRGTIRHRLPIFHGDLAPTQRRAFARWLLWASRGGVRRPAGRERAIRW